MIKKEILIAFVTLICAAQAIPLAERIIGGSDASQGQFPYQALLRRFFDGGGWSWCGAILFDSRWVLTAAHCLIEPDPISFEVHLGSIYFNPSGDDPNRLVVYATNRVVHQGYLINENKPIYDIGLVEFPYSIEFNDFINPVQLPSRDSGNFFYENTVASGWGYVEHEVAVAPERLQYAPHIVMSNEECGNWFFSGFVPEESIVCAMGPNSEGICHGDSGGPLVTVDRDTKILVGISNFRHNEACGVGPGGFARVSAYLDWIAEHTGLSV